MTDTLMDKVWEAYWQPEPHGTQAALERVLALVLQERADEIERLRGALQHAKPYVDAAVKSAQQRGAVTMADILVPEIVRNALELPSDRDRYDFQGETPVFVVEGDAA